MDGWLGFNAFQARK